MRVLQHVAEHAKFEWWPTRDEIGQVRIIVPEQVNKGAHEPHCVIITIQQPVVVYTLLLKLLMCNKWRHGSSAVKGPVNPAPWLIPNVRIVCPELIVPLAIFNAWRNGGQLPHKDSFDPLRGFRNVRYKALEQQALCTYVLQR